MAVRRALGLYTSRLAALAEAKRTPEQAKRQTEIKGGDGASVRR